MRLSQVDFEYSVVKYLSASFCLEFRRRHPDSPGVVHPATACTGQVLKLVYQGLSLAAMMAAQITVVLGSYVHDFRANKFWRDASGWTM